MCVRAGVRIGHNVKIQIEKERKRRHYITTSNNCEAYIILEENISGNN